MGWGRGQGEFTGQRTRPRRAEAAGWRGWEGAAPQTAWRAADRGLDRWRLGSGAAFLGRGNDLSPFQFGFTDVAPWAGVVPSWA